MGSKQEIDVFLSYNRDDKTVVNELADALRKGGLQVWWDIAIEPSDLWQESLEDAIARARFAAIFAPRQNPVGEFCRSGR